jgi:hypothetical protein
LTLGPRAKLALILGGFTLPIAASFLVYAFLRPAPTANYGELLLPPESITTSAFTRPSGAPFRFQELSGRWILLASEAGSCDEACRAKLVAMRQVRLALGREVDRVAMVTVLADAAPLPTGLEAEHPDMTFARAPGRLPPSSATADPTHIYVVDPLGNVMMRWPARPDYKRMKGDLDRLLKASQVG